MPAAAAGTDEVKKLSTAGPVLVTGCAGFIGYHFCERLLADGIPVVGVDNLSGYYDVSLKEQRLQRLLDAKLEFHRIDIAQAEPLRQLVDAMKPGIVVHLAAQPGVRYSLENPAAYAESNIVGSLNVLESCRHAEPAHLVFASSSSVYGANKELPFSVMHNVDLPVSLYAATKKSCELMAHTYSHLFHIPTTGLRFFTVYGPWGRPDMAYYSFTRAILAGEPIKIFNNGNMQRDFTYIDDIVEGIIRVAAQPPGMNSAGTARFRLYNIGNSKPENLLRMIELLESYLGKKAVKEFMPMQPGDVEATYADISELVDEFGYRPQVTIEDGLQRFIEWYVDYYGDHAE